MLPQIVFGALCAFAIAAPVVAGSQKASSPGKAAIPMDDYVSTALAGFAPGRSTSIDAEAPGYEEFFYQDGTWSAETSGRVTLNYSGKWLVRGGRVCVYHERGEHVCRDIVIENEKEVSIENIFSTSRKLFRIVKTKI